MPPLLQLSREALARLGVDATGLPAIRTVCESFARVSPLNLVVAACLACRLGEGQSGAEPAAITPEPADLPAPLPAMPGMVPDTEMSPEMKAVLATFETGLAGEVFVLGLYRILAHWPGFLGTLSTSLAPGESTAVLSAIRTYRGTSLQMIGFGALILEALPPDRAGPDGEVVRRRPSPAPYRSP